MGQQCSYINYRTAAASRQILIEQGIMHHVNDEHSFKDTYLSYRFFADEI
ncbi:hypothetical protein PN441_07395 [Spirulina major CS-329]|nr:MULTISPECIES: hypothetical protein [Spirulina]MDB9496811.1 hypothetical protein [Spirulina subsalsa CS-330]MDB9502892.1 hypothetical protein [Spirulina major CS-329]